MFQQRFFLILAQTLFLSFIIFYAGCESNTEPTSTTSQNFSLSLKTPVNTPKQNGDVLMIDEAKILVRDLKLISSQGDDSMSVEIGPFVLNLNLSGSLNTYSFNNVTTNLYKSVKWEIHKPEDNEIPPDPEFRDGESGNERYSVIVKGTFNGASFVYKSTKTSHQKIDFPTPLEISSDQAINVTLIVDPYSWFNDDGVVLDPNDNSNENDIDNLIASSFKDVFKDFNRDGNPD